MRKNAPVRNLLHVLLQLLFVGVRVQGELQPRRGTKLNQADSHLEEDGVTWRMTDMTERDEQRQTNLIWSDVQRLAEFDGVVFGPLEAALPHAVRTIHEEEDIHGC